jgi:hypothetical protein
MSDTDLAAKKRRVEAAPAAAAAAPVAAAGDAAARQKRYGAVLDDVWKWDAVGMFHTAVLAADVPDYRDVVASPIDITTLRGSVADGTCADDGDFRDALHRMAANALLYNEAGNAWHNHAAALMKKVPKYLARHGVAPQGEDDTYVPTKRCTDDEATFAKAEKRGGEDMGTVLVAMRQDGELSIEELRAKYARKDADASDESDGDDDDDDDGSSSSDDEEDDEEGSGGSWEDSTNGSEAEDGN